MRRDQHAQMVAIDEAISTLYGYSPKPSQREALHHLIYLRKDLVLIAGTGFGKSMMFQAVSVLLRKSVTIVLLPLNQIGIEQSDYIRRIGGNPCFLNSDTISTKLLDEVKKGRYSHVLISPELAIGNEEFRRVVSEPSFNQKVALVVVDETHLVHNWAGNFRPAYSRLNVLRDWLGSQIPWLACSATMDSKTLNSLGTGINFEPDVKVQRMSIDCPELLFRLGWIPKKAGFKALQFLFVADEKSPDTIYHPLSTIPKTIVFFDSREDAHAAAEECCRWLLEVDSRCSLREVTQVLKVFHRNTADADKKTILDEFDKKKDQRHKSESYSLLRHSEWMSIFGTFVGPFNIASPSVSSLHHKEGGEHVGIRWTEK
ncbi:hypothetical protein VTN31DRAFT_3060 [Thermomyces dupontii]|uniref:uncharacterized protein n=1 Tax=Talaromyces thermophilus TaxID=28565 RepID=UPI003742B243